MEGETIQVRVPLDNEGERIDLFLASSLEEGFSRSRIQKLAGAGNVTVNGEAVKNKYRVKADDLIEITLPEMASAGIEPENIPLDIIYEDASILVLNKQAGLTVHPGPGNPSGTLVNALMYHVRDLSSIGGVERPGIVHRLDKDTAGLMVVAKNDRAHQRLTEAFAGRRVGKRYRAMVTGRMKSATGTVDLPIGRHPVYRHKMAVDSGGRDALTEYRVEGYWNTGTDFFTLLDIRIHTGRTHQIRVHMSHLGNPVVGDPIYSRKWEKYGVPYLLLASVELSFVHPETGAPLVFTAPLPDHFSAFIDRLGARSGNR